MAEKKSSKANLGEIVKHGKFYNTLGQVVKNPTDTNQIGSFLSYFSETQNPSEEELRDTHELIWGNPTKTGHYAMPYLQEHQGEIIKQVSRNPKTVLSNLEGSTLQALAEPHLGNEEYQTRVQILEKGEDSHVRNATIGMHKSRLYQEIAAGSSTEALRTVLGNKVSRDKRGYMEKDLGYKAETGEINQAKAAGYLAPHIKTPEQKLELGLMYTQTAMANQNQTQK